MPAPYATPADLTAWLGDTYPTPTGAAADRIIERAWEVIDDHTTAYVDTTVLDATTGRTIADALVDAVCAQVEQWAEVGEDNDIAGYPADTFMSTGISVNRQPDTLAPRAARILRKAGILLTTPRAAPIGVTLT